MKNAIVIISIGRDQYLKWALKSVEPYCKKIGCALEVVTTPKWKFKATNGYNYKTFEKNQVYEFFDEYDRILRLDSDIIINKNCPDVFDNDPTKIYATREDKLSRKNNRLQQIHLTKRSLGQIKGWDDFYVNSGVILASKEHRDIFKLTEEDIKLIKKKQLGDFKEQNFLNWRIHKLGFDIIDIGPQFNHLSMFDKKYDKYDSFIIHYAGPQNGKKEKMKRDYIKLYG